MNAVRGRASCCDRWPRGDVIYNMPSVPALLEAMFLIAGHGFHFKTSNSLGNTDLSLATTVSIISQVNWSSNFSFSLGDSWSFHLLNRFESICCRSVLRHILICSSEFDDRTAYRFFYVSKMHLFLFMCMCFAWMCM